MTMKEHVFERPHGGNESQGWALLSVCWAFVTVATLTTLLRIFIRTRLTHNFGADDSVITLCLFTTWLGAGLITTEIIEGGLGRHGYYLEPSQKRHFLALGWADWIQTFITLGLMKISICLFLLRIVDSKKLRGVLWFMIGFLVVFTIVFAGLFLGICSPIKAYWTVMPNSRCFSDTQVEMITVGQGIISAFTDFVLAGFPYFFLRNLQVSSRTKLAIYGLMGLGAITGVCAIVRTALSGALTHPDITWSVVANVAWRLPEVNIGIACANAPMLRPLYLYLRGRLDTERAKKGSTSYAAHSSKDRFVMPGNSRWGRSAKQDSTTLQGSEHNIATELSVDLELAPKADKEELGTKSEAWASV